MNKFSRPDVLEAIAARKSSKKLGENTPSDEELQELMKAVVQVPNHGSLDCWRMHTLRGDDLINLGHAFNKADGVESDEPNKKPLRANLLIAIIASPVESKKVPEWEQIAAAAGAGHFMSLALWAAGWGSVWRTGTWADAQAVRDFHSLSEGERILGWIYVGHSKDENFDLTPKKRVIPDNLLTPLPKQ